MKGIAPKEVKIQNIYRGIIPFVMIQVAGVIIVLAYPETALWLARLAG